MIPMQFAIDLRESEHQQDGDLGEDYAQEHADGIDCGVGDRGLVIVDKG